MNELFNVTCSNYSMVLCAMNLTRKAMMPLNPAYRQLLEEHVPADSKAKTRDHMTHREWNRWSVDPPHKNNNAESFFMWSHHHDFMPSFLPDFFKPIYAKVIKLSLISPLYQNVQNDWYYTITLFYCAQHSTFPSWGYIPMPFILAPIICNTALYGHHMTVCNQWVAEILCYLQRPAHVTIDILHESLLFYVQYCFVLKARGGPSMNYTSDYTCTSIFWPQCNTCLIFKSSQIIRRPVAENLVSCDAG